MKIGKWFKRNKRVEIIPVTDSFVTFILLEDKTFDFQTLLKDIKSDWEYEIPPEDLEVESTPSLVTEVDGVIVAVSLVPNPLPNNIAEDHARTNTNWEGVEDAALRHEAYVMVVVINKGASTLSNATLSVQVSSSIARQKNAIAIDSLGTLYEPEYYIKTTNVFLDEDMLPIPLMIFIGIYEQNNKINGYTYGMHHFGKQELEVLSSRKSPEEIYHFLTDVAAYLISENVALKDGESIGFSIDQRIPVSLSKGIATIGNTFKIRF